MFPVDATTVFSCDATEAAATSGLIEKTGTWAIGSVGSNPTVTTGPRANVTARHLNGTSMYFAVTVTSSSSANATRDIITGTNTFEACIRSLSHTTAPGIRRTILLAGYTDAALLWLVFSPNNGFEILYTPTLGGIMSSISLAGPTLTQDVWTYIALRKTPTGGTPLGSQLNTYELFVRPLTGAFGSDTPDVTVLNGGQSGLQSTVHFDFGANAGGPSVNAPQYFGLHDIGPTRFSSGTRTAADLRESFKRLGPIDGVAPVVSNVLPTVGSALTTTTPVQLDITDNLNLFSRIMVIASFPPFGIKEVVHDGDNFGPNYLTASSTRTAITNGFRYTLLRNGGWPSAPTIIPYALDTSGNEDV